MSLNAPIPPAEQLLNQQSGPILLVFAAVYLGMFLGGWPGLKLDRSGVALLGGIAMVALTGMTLDEAAQAVDMPTMGLLLAFMVLSAQLRQAGFYAAVTRRLVTLSVSTPWLLAALMSSAAGLSAVFSNDVVCLAMTPWVARLGVQRRVDPIPLLVGLACAANIGSAGTLIGNPQNMLIGSVLSLDFAAYMAVAALPTALALVMAWGWVAVAVSRSAQSAEPSATSRSVLPPAAPEPFDRWQTAKGLAVALTLMGVFLATDLPKATAALLGAGVLMLSRRLHSADVLGQIDWPLLVLFGGLFVVNHGLQTTGAATHAVQWLAAQGLALNEPGSLLVLAVGLSNLVSNVPAVMLLLPHLPAGDAGAQLQAGALLALASTFAGNLLLVGSIANLIVADLAAKEGIVTDWRRHAAIGIPVTLLSLAVLWAFAVIQPAGFGH